MSDDRTPEQIAAEIIARARTENNGKAKPLKITRNQGAAILDGAFAFLKRFVAYPSEHAHVAHVLWIAHAHLMSAWESTPRLAFLSPEPASGKTRSMEVSELLVPDPVAAVNVTPAYLFRKCGSEDGPPTILFDEIDSVFGPKARENEELRALLNSGHRRGATAGRCVVRGKIVETEEISSYAAVALAGLGWLPDTILSRSVIIRMRRRAPEERIEAFRRRVHAPVGEALRRRLAGWAATILDEATDARPDMPAGVEDRDADVWEPLLAVADIAGGDWPQRARDAAVKLVAVARQAEPSLNIRLLGDLRTIFMDRLDVVLHSTPPGLPTKTILSVLPELEDAPWGDLKGKPITDHQLARRLRHYEIRSKNIRPEGGSECKGYDYAELGELWRRYLPPLADKPVASVATVESPENEAFSATDMQSGAVADSPEPSHDSPYATVPTADETACDGSSGAETPHEMGLATVATDATDLAGGGGDEPGLTWHTVDRLANEVEEWAYANRDKVRTDQASVIEAEIRRRVIGAGVLPETVAIETERVMTSLFEGREAAGALSDGKKQSCQK
jgi:hypothetical protein